MKRRKPKYKNDEERVNAIREQQKITMERRKLLKFNAAASKGNTLFVVLVL